MQSINNPFNPKDFRHLPDLDNNEMTKIQRIHKSTMFLGIPVVVCISIANTVLCLAYYFLGDALSIGLRRDFVGSVMTTNLLFLIFYSFFIMATGLLTECIGESLEESQAKKAAAMFATFKNEDLLAISSSPEVSDAVKRVVNEELIRRAFPGEIK